ncbi:hypothetical protein RRG08_033494 [Elysia crispata]|uniref:Uncharacterized protein n=1 Tax=Elysia crispata TaxID=231223 RepID=A0AAE1E5T3_9GAST|nr:hypothetical protein RRG08_033494 [Elysia crispata]
MVYIQAATGPSCFRAGLVSDRGSSRLSFDWSPSSRRRRGEVSEVPTAIALPINYAPQSWSEYPVEKKLIAIGFGSSYTSLGPYTILKEKIYTARNLEERFVTHTIGVDIAASFTPLAAPVLTATLRYQLCKGLRRSRGRCNFLLNWINSTPSPYIQEYGTRGGGIEMGVSGRRTPRSQHPLMTGLFSKRGTLSPLWLHAPTICPGEPVRFDRSSTDVKFLDSKGQENAMVAPSSPSSQEGTEAPTSSTTTPAVTTQVTEDIANGYRTCLRYFLPPQWIMDKDAITAMSLQELSDFPLDDFFDHYERGLRRLVSNFQTEASLRKQESEEAKAKLVEVRKLIAKLLKSTNEDFDLDPEEAGDQVDELLAACVKQATSQT